MGYISRYLLTYTNVTYTVYAITYLHTYIHPTMGRIHRWMDKVEGEDDTSDFLRGVEVYISLHRTHLWDPVTPIAMTGVGVGVGRWGGAGVGVVRGINRENKLWENGKRIRYFSDVSVGGACVRESVSEWGKSGRRKR